MITVMDTKVCSVRAWSSRIFTLSIYFNQLTFSCFNYVIQITRTYLESLTLISSLECKIDYDENSTRTQVLHSHTCNVAGFEWIRRQLSRRGLRAHLMQTPNVLNPSHYDASIMPLRSDLLLVSPLVVDDVDIFRENGWHVEVCVEPEIDQVDDPNYHGKSGKWICMNVLPLGPEKVAVMEHDVAVAKQLESLDFEVVLVPFKDVVEFGGALHCCTMDIRRLGTCESYFPTLD